MQLVFVHGAAVAQGNGPCVDRLDGIAVALLLHVAGVGAPLALRAGTPRRSAGGGVGHKRLVALFFTVALTRQIFPPQFNCYRGGANVFGNHVDNAVRTHASTGKQVRTDLSAPLFLSEPGEYDGGELIVEETFGTQSVKPPAGDMILYPASSVHRVEPITRGARVASFFWIESMVREVTRRRLLFELDLSILGLRGSIGDTADVVRLTSCYHNLLRQWASA